METLRGETRLSEHRGGLIWKIRDFSIHRSSHKDNFLNSPSYKIAGLSDISCKVALYPRGIDKKHIKVELYVDNGQAFFIICDFALVGKTGQEMYATTVSGWHSCEDFNKGTYLGPEKTFSEQEKALLLPNDVLTLSCVLRLKGKENVIVYRSTVSGDRNLNTLAEDFAKLFQEKRNTDVVLKVGSHHIDAHKTVLACRSAVFSSMFERDMQEKKTNEVDVADVEFDVFNALVRFLYTDEIDFEDASFALKLLVAADKYDVPLLQARCAEYLYAEISEKNVFEICVAADSCREHELKGRCLQFMRAEMSSVTSLADWISQMKSYPQALDFLKECVDANE